MGKDRRRHSSTSVFFYVYHNRQFTSELLYNYNERKEGKSMGDYLAYDPFSVCFNILKMRYRDYDESLTSKNFLNPNDKINVFINLETVYKHLSMIMELEKKIVIQRDFNEIMISNILNLAAHYKRFFVNNGLDTRVYLYNTDFDSDEFNQFKYNEDYRSYYLVKFNDNPKFALLTEKLKGKILPDIRTYCEFIPNVYYISAKNIEGSLVPYIIAESDKSRKNLIIGGELYDTQYSVIPNFVNHYIKRNYNTNAIYSDINGYLKDILKKEEIYSENMKSLFGNYSLYCTLMSVLGDRTRSIDGISGYGLKTLHRELEAGLAQQIIGNETTNPEILGEIFHDGEIKEEFVNNFYCSSIIPMYQELTGAQKNSILQQRVDRLDINTLQYLNSTKFYNHPLLLEGLLI